MQITFSEGYGLTNRQFGGVGVGSQCNDNLFGKPADAVDWPFSAPETKLECSEELSSPINCVTPVNGTSAFVKIQADFWQESFFRLNVCYESSVLVSSKPKADHQLFYGLVMDQLDGQIMTGHAVPPASYEVHILFFAPSIFYHPSKVQIDLGD